MSQWKTRTGASQTSTLRAGPAAAGASPGELVWDSDVVFIEISSIGAAVAGSAIGCALDGCTFPGRRWHFIVLTPEPGGTCDTVFGRRLRRSTTCGRICAQPGRQFLHCRGIERRIGAEVVGQMG